MNKIEKYLEEKCSKIQEKNEREAQEENDAPCAVCGSTDFVQKFRNVVGEVTGYMQGNFSLFGGSICGKIDGYTKTLPVLSCRKCENEREIVTWKYIDERDVFWMDMHNFYFYFHYYDESRKDIKSIYLENPKDTYEYMLAHRNYKFRFYNDISTWHPKIWERMGFKVKKEKKKFLFWESDYYPPFSEY